MDGIRVGSFELFPSERLLCAAGRPLELGARAFDLLLVLVEQPGHLVTKTTLLDRVWPGLVVDENNLPAQIASLRRVLGAGAIRTVPGFGYRLELPLQSLTAAPRESAHATPPPREPPRLCLPARHWPDRQGTLIGRDEDVQGVRQALERAPLVSIVGIAGVGKTRLAQEILLRESVRPAHAVAWVALGSVAGIEHVPSSIAVALGLSLPDGANGFAALCQALEQVSLLLILDSVEHLTEALVTPLQTMVTQTQALRLLLTSQVPLGLSCERVYRLGALPILDPHTAPLDGPATGGSAVALFAQRVAALDQRFTLSAANLALVSTICRRLDGIPLALELAAARVPALGLQALLERLDDRFRLLRSAGRPRDVRHDTLYAAFDWSYGLLSAAEQRAFRRLGAFAGSFSLQAATHCITEAGTDAADAVDLVIRLVDRSLLSTLPGEPPRYQLSETARVFARERLAAGVELEDAYARMAAAVLATLDVAYEQYWSLDEAEWLHRNEPELDNARSALDWAVRGEHSIGVELFGSAWPLFVESDCYAEGRGRYERVLALLRAALPTRRIGRFWEAIAAYDSARQWDRARYAAELAAAHYASTPDAHSRYRALVQLALNCPDDVPAAEAALQTARRLEEPGWPARLLAHGALAEGALRTDQRRFAEARAAYQRAVGLALASSERQALAATVSVVELDIACGDTEAALGLGRPLESSLRHLGRRETRLRLLMLIFSAQLLAGRTGEARTTGAELYELACRLEMAGLYAVIDAMALLACQDRRLEAAARIARCADVALGAQGQTRRNPAAERVRAALTASLQQQLGPQWASAARASGGPLSEAAACRLALGLADD